MLQVLVNGACGRMGREVISQITNSPLFELACGIDTKLDELCFPIYKSPYDVKETVDVIIDFSVPEASLSVLKYAKEKHIPIVIATTGFSKEQENIIADTANYIPIFKSANMSYEINLIANLLSKIATSLSDSDIEIVETHHRNKIDAPSGTALLLADSINNALNNTMDYCYSRHERRKKRTDKEIGFSCIRGGTEAGKHSVLFLGENETLEISHTVTSRSVFAKGALKATEFIINKQNGLYSMKNIIG